MGNEVSTPNNKPVRRVRRVPIPPQHRPPVDPRQVRQLQQENQALRAQLYNKQAPHVSNPSHIQQHNGNPAQRGTVDINAMNPVYKAQQDRFLDPTIIQRSNVGEQHPSTIGALTLHQQPITPDNFHSRKQQFEQQQRQEREQFEKRQFDARKAFEAELNQFSSQYNPYAFLKVDQNVTRDELKRAYKKMAVKHHPDRGGSSKKFELITKAYVFIDKQLKEIERGSADHFQMKRGAETAMGSNDLSGGYTGGHVSEQEKVYIDKRNFNVKKFNQVFDKHRIATSNDRGYGDMMTGGEREDNIPMLEGSRSELFTDEFNLKLFNKMFSDKHQDETVDRGVDNRGRVVVYKEPEALVSGNLNFTELGHEDVDDFTGESGRGLQYTDYMQAHVKQARLINPEKVKGRKSYKNINELKMARSKISHDLSPEQQALIERQKAIDEQFEIERQRKLAEKDRIYQQHYDHMNQLFIKQ